ncbi:transporter [Amedibacillus sp. YH-ame10]
MKGINEKLVRVTKGLELAIAVLLIVAITVSAIYVVFYAGNALKEGSFQLESFMKTVLTLVVGIEFAKMLILHTPESVLEVLLYAVARQIVIYHDSALENLVGVLAVGVIFAIRKYLSKEKSEKA